MCDVAYAVQVEQLERWVATERQVAATLMAAGAEGVELPDISSLRQSFDEELEAPFRLVVEDPERYLNRLRAGGLDDA